MEATESPSGVPDAGAASAASSAATEPTAATEVTNAAAATEEKITAATATEAVEQAIVEALKTVFDPEIPVNIYEMGLIYDLNVEPGGKVQIKMTLTSPGCPVAGTLPVEVKDRTEAVPGVSAAEVEVVWDPVWNPSMMSEAARLELGMF